MDKVSQCLEFLQELKGKQHSLDGAEDQELCVIATGGGAHKYYDNLRSVLDVEVVREDEMECLVSGMLIIAKVRKADG